MISLTLNVQNITFDILVIRFEFYFQHLASALNDALLEPLEAELARQVEYDMDEQGVLYLATLVLTSLNLFHFR